MAKPKQTSILSFFENRSSVTAVSSSNNEKEVDVNSINAQNECEGEASCSEPQFEELLSVPLRGSDCVAGVHNDEVCVIDLNEDSSESGEEDFDEIEDATVSETKCIADCCSLTRDKPNQPTEKSVLTKTKRFQGSGKSRQARCVQPCWFQKHKWLSLCATRNKLFCFVCFMAVQRNLLTFSKNVEPSFTTTGFCNWRKAGQCFRKHEASLGHREALLKVNNTQDISAQLNAAHKDNLKVRRIGLMKQLSSLRYLLRQGLAVRGHKDINSNLYQLLCLRSEDDHQLCTWLKDHKYFSPDILNEQIELMGHSVLRSILKDIQSAGWYSIMVDEATDISRNEQMCICIRWVDDDYVVNEDTIGLVHVNKTDSNTLFTELKAALTCCMFPLDKCRGQAYDGAANMSGKHRGVAALVKQAESAALYVHCLAHSLNLCLQDVARSCLSISEGLLFIRELVQLIKWSPKRHSLFETLKLENSPDTPNLRTLCPTRWTVRNGAIDAILKNYEVLCKTLNEISEGGRDEYALKANGLLHTMEKFSTYFGLKLGYLIFSVTEQLSCSLQGKDTTCQEAKEAALLSTNYLKKLRSDEEFKKFYAQVLQRSQGLTNEPTLPRKRKLPKRINDGAESHQFGTPEAMHRQQYFLALDQTANELLRRFDQKDLNVVIDIENLLLKCSNECEVDVCIPESLITTYQKDLNFEKIKQQLKLMPDLILRHKEITGNIIKKVTNVRTLCEVFNSNPVVKRMCPEIHTLLKLYMTVPVTTATAERTFSVMRRIKTYLHSNMSQQRLNHTILLHCYQDRIDSLDLKDIAKYFVSANDRRQLYFGQF